MKQLILDYFAIHSIKTRFKNRRISLFSYFDKQTVISQFAKINRFVTLRGCIINPISFIGPNCHFINVEIGKFCSISKNVNIGLFTHPTNLLSTSPIFISNYNGTGLTWVNDKTFDDMPHKTVIGNDVWIGMNVSISGGIKVGDGAIIGAHAMVTRDIPPFAIVGGIPARVIKFRFNEEVISRLINLKWWDLPFEFLKNNFIFFQKPLNLTIIKEIEEILHEYEK